MPTFIKTGFWERQKTGYDGWLNLEDLINLLIQQSGGGGNQDLQSVLNNGNTANNISIELGNSINDNVLTLNSTSLNFSNDNDKSIFLDLDQGIFYIISNSIGGVGLSALDGLRLYETATTFTTNIKQANGQISDITLLTPVKTGGIYTLATLDDIPSGGNQDLQSVLTQGNITNLSARFVGLVPEEYSILDNYSLQFNAAGVRSNVSASTISVVKGEGSNLVTTFIDGFGFNQQGINKAVGLNFNSGLFLKTNETSISGVIITANNSIAGTLTLQTPNKTGEFTLATTDDILSWQQLYDVNSTIISDNFFMLKSDFYNSSGIIGATQFIIKNDITLSQFTFDGENKRIVSSENGNSTILNIPVVLGQSLNFTLPSKNTGSYTLATTDDIIVSPIKTVGTNSLFSVIPLAGVGITTLDSSIFFGDNAGSNATAANSSNFLGRGAGREATNASDSNFFGFSAGFFAVNAQNSNFIGNSAGSSANNASFSNFLGREAGRNASGANNSNFLGVRAGFNATDALNSNFLGKNAGNGASLAEYSNLFGFNVGQTYAGNNIGPNNIIIGTNISLPNGVANAINIGGVIFGFNTHSTVTGDPSITNTINGRVGINKAIDNNVDTLQIGGTLNIGTVGTGPSINNLGIDANGQVVVGTSGGSTIPVSGTQSGIVNNVALQELGGVDKLINEVRIGRGNGNDSNNLVYGFGTLAANTTGVYNLAIGSEVMAKLTTGNNNVGVGHYALYEIISGIYNTAVGQGALQDNLGSFNDAFGAYALGYNSTGQYNTAIGNAALSENRFGSQNVAVGAYALYLTQGVNGSESQGARCVAIGTKAMENNTTGNGTAVGNEALLEQTTGAWNIAIGQKAGSNITTGSNNIVITVNGVNPNSGITTGNNNLLIAQNFGGVNPGITTASGNTILGRVLFSLVGNIDNQVFLADGTGNASGLRFKSDTNGVCTVPTQSNINIDNDITGFAIVTKGYLNTILSTRKRRKDVKYFAAGNIPQGTVLGSNFEEILYQSYKLIKVVVVFGEQSMNTNKTIPFEIKTIDTDSAAPTATLQYTANCNAVVGAIQNKRYIFDVDVTLPADKLLTVNTGAFTASTQILNNCLVTLVLEEI